MKKFPETNEITAAATVILLVSQELHRYEPSRIQLTSPTQCHRVGHTGTGRRRQYLLYTGIKCMLDPYRMHIPMQTLKSLTESSSDQVQAKVVKPLAKGKKRRRPK